MHQAIRPISEIEGLVMVVEDLSGRSSRLPSIQRVRDMRRS